MPLYPMKCDSCKHEEELVQSIKIDLPKECPKCKKEGYYVDCSKLTTLFIDYTMDGAKTIGQLAERNTKRLSSEERQRKLDKYIKRQKPRKKQWWQKLGDG